jgi:xanthine dehydrogenase accessory factor
MKFWKQLYDELLNGQNVALLYVHSSEGSSPGRQGFKMFVSSNGELQGSIGGGPMEFKLVELSKSKLKEGHFPPLLQRQIHKSNIPKDKSGMICSGEQTVGIYYLSSDQRELLWSIVFDNADKTLVMNNDGLHLEDKSIGQKEFIRYQENEPNWTLEDDLTSANEIHIIGAGHVSLALSILANQLDFKVNVYDTREALNTLPSDSSITFTLVSDYAKIGDFISSGENKYVVLMSFGFRTDKVALQPLLDKDFKYLGMMGSAEKTKTLISELIEEGIDPQKLEHVHAPIGIQISSKTPMEIAVSIMAEIIRLKNA